MLLNNVILLNSTQGILGAVGSPVRGSGAGRSIGGIYTVMISASNLQGNVYIDATLAADPQDSDWFSITPPNSSTPYVNFVGGLGAQSVGYTFKGNFTWIRARLDQSYLGVPTNLTSLQNAAYGYVDNVTLNMGPWSTDATVANSVVTPTPPTLLGVTGNNLGDGTTVFANSVGQSTAVLNFKTLLSGNGISLTDDGEMITISAGQSGGGAEYIEQMPFTGLTDTPNAITTSGLLLGSNTNSLEFLPPPAVNSSLVFSNSSVAWSPITTNTEYVVLQYSANASQYLSGNAVVSNTTGVMANVVDVANCVVDFTFTGYASPPVSVAVMGQNLLTGAFQHATVPALTISGSCASSPLTLMTTFSGPVAMTLPPSTVGAVANAAQAPQAVIVFRF